MIDTKCDLDVNLWYLDDGTLIGTRSEVLKALHIIMSFGNGTILNLTKCELYWMDISDAFPEFPPEIIRKDSLDLLGVPITHPQTHFEGQLKKMAEALEKLTNMNDTQAEYCLLRSAINVGKLQHSLRNIPPWMIDSQLKEADEVLRRGAENIFQEGLDGTVTFSSYFGNVFVWFGNKKASR